MFAFAFSDDLFPPRSFPHPRTHAVGFMSYKEERFSFAARSVNSCDPSHRAAADIQPWNCAKERSVIKISAV